MAGIPSTRARAALPPEQMSLIRGRIYNRKKGKQGAPGGNQNRAIQKDQIDPIESQSTAETVAKETGLSTLLPQHPIVICPG